MKMTIKNILRGCSAVLVLMFVLPTFAVSCGSEEIDVSALGVMTGVKYEGTRVSDPHFFAVLALIVPVALLVLWFINEIKKSELLSEKLQTTLAIIVAAADMLVWIILSAGVALYAADEGLGFRTTLAYSLNMNLLWLVIVFCILVKLGVFTLETDVMKFFSGRANMQTTQANGPRCTNCGEVFKAAEKFCGKCGTPRPEEMAEQQAGAFCAQCGAELNAGQKFCAKCGAKAGE